MDNIEKDYNFTREEFDSCIKVLRALAKDPYASPNTEMIKGLIAKIYKKVRKDNKKAIQNLRKDFDNELLESTIVKKLPENSLENMYINNEVLDLESKEQDFKNNFNPNIIKKKESILIKPINCYICKISYNQVHFFYHLLCPECAEFNYKKRFQKVDLSGRTALITGGRIKIGFETALKLLRDNAKVILTTRFPYDASLRFSQEKDFEQWKDNLKIYGLELRNLPLVELFIKHIIDKYDSLDIIINNAAQTIKRPLEFYNHLILKEEELKRNRITDFIVNDIFNYSPNKYLPEIKQDDKNLITKNNYFPTEQYDTFLQQVDLRPENSWVLTLDKVDTLELIETHLVNSFAPFIINSKLKVLMNKSKFDKKFIINVSAMEGQFNRKNKTEFHPHTNMAKAALNMMTRTSAKQYAKENIFMNSVDTGWITQENPYHKMYKLRKKGFVPPLDIIDGASRVYDPIVSGILENEPIFGKFLKDYKEYDW